MRMKAGKLTLNGALVTATVCCLVLITIGAFLLAQWLGSAHGTEIALLVLSAELFLTLAVVTGPALWARAQSRELMRTSARLKAVSESSLEAILVCDASGHVIDFNAAAEQVFGFTADEITGQSFAEHIIPEHLRSAHAAGFKRFLETGDSKLVGAGRVEVEARHASGKTFPLELAINKTETPDGPIYLSFMRDISDRVESEQALRQARDDALAGEKAKANLLAVMSHEMRTPLNGILGTLELLSATELNEEQREHIEIMTRSGDLLLTHVNDVLELSRLDAGQAEINETVFDLGSVTSEIADGLRQLAAANGSSITVDIDDASIGHVTGDLRCLRQILVNLVGNAVKFTSAGKIGITLCRPDGGDRVQLQVTDTGIGIAPEDLERIFDEFVTIDPSYDRKAEGTGLGLSITHRLVKALEGEIEVTSTEGDGTTFRVSLPLPDVPVGRRKLDQVEPEVKEKPFFPGLSVLLVEDNPINRRIARAMLTKMGCVVTEACDGAEGVEMARDRSFNVILMDISMPNMDGVEATKTIRAGPSACKNTVIVALTAHAMQEDVARFEEAGMNSVVVKPISSERLAEAIDRRRARSSSLAETVPQAVWDMHVFNEFLEVLGAEDTGEMLEKFMADAETVVPWLVWQSSEEANRDQVATRAHGLAGSAAVLGASGLHAALRALETAARKGEALAPGSDNLNRAWAATRNQKPDLNGDDAVSAA